MLKEKLQKLNLYKSNGDFNSPITKSKEFKLLVPEILNQTSWLDDKTPISFRIKCILEHITFDKAPKCSYCDKPIIRTNGKEFKTYCDRKCSANDVNKQKKLLKSFNENIQNTINKSIIKEVKISKEKLQCILYNKPKASNWDLFLSENFIYNQFYSYKLYEDDTPLEISFRILNNLKERPKCECGKFITFRQGREYKNIYPDTCDDTTCKTFLENRNNLKKQTKLELHGDENYHNTLLMKQTKLERYNNENYVNDEQRRKTCTERYGDEYYDNSDYMKEWWNVQTDEDIEEIVKQRKQTKLERYGDENFVNALQTKQTKLERYRDENFNNTKKARATCVKKYGVYNYAQLGITNGYKWKDYVMPSGKIVRIQGYEDKLLDILLLNFEEDDIIIERTKFPKFWYYDKDNKIHRYFPDFYIPKINTIYEVKSEYTYNVNLDINLRKQQCVIDANYKYELHIF